MKRPAIDGLILGFLLLAGSGTQSLQAAEGDFLDHYKAGLEAVGKKDWQKAADEMRLAIAEQPGASPRLKRRLYFKRYIPHYFLGRALFESQDCRGAVKAWETSEAQGIVQRYDEMAALKRDRETCSSRKSAAKEALEAARATFKEATQANDESATLPGPELRASWERGSPSLASRRTAARKALGAARDALNDLGEPADSQKIERAHDLARSALQAFGDLEKEVEVHRARLSGEKNNVRQSLEPLRKRAERTLASLAYLEPLPPRLASRASRLKALATASRAVNAASTAKELQTLRKNLSTSLKRLEAAAAPPPKELSTAVEAFFQGDYQTVLDTLDGLDLTGPKARAHSHLFLAAARYALFVAGGEREDELLAAARQDALACRTNDPERAPEANAFSPRFIEFFLALEPDEEIDDAEEVSAESELGT